MDLGGGMCFMVANGNICRTCTGPDGFEKCAVKVDAEIEVEAKPGQHEEEEMGDDGTSVCIAKEGLINKKLIAGCLTKNYDQCKTSRLCKLRNKEKKKKSKKQARMEMEIEAKPGQEGVGCPP